METCSHNDAAAAGQLAVLAGTLAHLSSYLKSGCTRSLHRAQLLLARLDSEPVCDQDMLAFCRTLEEAVTTAYAARRPQ